MKTLRDDPETSSRRLVRLWRFVVFLVMHALFTSGEDGLEASITIKGNKVLGLS